MTKFEKYTDSLFILINYKANVREFIDLYELTFNEPPSAELKSSYQLRINSDRDNEEYDQDSYSYEESYDYDDN